MYHMVHVRKDIMGRQRIEHHATTTADPATVYGLLRDGAGWPTWSPIDSFELERPGAERARGRGRRPGVPQRARDRARRDRRAGRRIAASRTRTPRASRSATTAARSISQPTSEAEPRSAGCRRSTPKVPGTGPLLRRALDGFVAKLAHGLADHAASVAGAHRQAA